MGVPPAVKFPGFTQIAALSGSSTTHCHSLHPYNNTSVIMTAGTKKTLLIIAILLVQHSIIALSVTVIDYSIQLKVQLIEV